MPVTYKWIISNIVVNESEGELKDVIKKFVWVYQGTDGTFIKNGRNGWAVFGEADPNNFRPFDDFTKSDFDTWLNNNISNIPEMQAEIDNLIEEEKSKAVTIKSPTWLSTQ